MGNKDYDKPISELQQSIEVLNTKLGIVSTTGDINVAKDLYVAGNAEVKGDVKVRTVTAQSVNGINLDQQLYLPRNFKVADDPKKRSLTLGGCITACNKSANCVGFSREKSSQDYEPADCHFSVNLSAAGVVANDEKWHTYTRPGAELPKF